MSLLTKAIQLATVLHEGQVDKHGEPYILHPLRVMVNMSTEDEMCVAVLHDVIEDTPCTAAYLLRQFPASIVLSIHSLSRLEGEPYRAYIERCYRDSVATRVKIYDMEDNLNPARAFPNDDTYLGLMDRYGKAKNYLTCGRWA